jgi:cyclic nucleotide gated channel
MGSIVYGDIIPFTLAEESISIIEMLIGRVFMSFLFAEVAGYVSQQYSAYDDHVHQQGIVMKWTQLNGLSKRLRHRIQKYFDLKWQNMKGIREEELILDLPNSLKKNVKNFLFDELIQNCDVFPRESVGTISTITAKL